MIKELLVLLGAFLGATLVAVLLGAVNTGTALTFGQLGLAAAFTWIVRQPPVAPQNAHLCSAANSASPIAVDAPPGRSDRMRPLEYDGQ